MGSNTAYFRFDEGDRTMQYIAQSHMYQSWISVANSNQYLVRESNVGIHQTTMTIRTGCVGIGTTLPVATLDVNGNINVRGTLNIPSYTFESSNQPTVLTVKQLTASCNIAGFYQGTQPVLLVGANNIGIGTSLPQWKLDVQGSIATTQQLVSTAPQGTAPLQVVSTTLNTNLNADLLDGQHGSFYQNATNINAGILSVSRGGTGSSNISASKLLVGNGSNTILTPTDLHWSGTNLGIGTSNPSTKLDVVGSVNVSGQFISALPSGTAPLQVVSTTLNTNLNADLLDGQHGSFYQNADNVITGTLTVSRGGTGSSNISASKLLVGNGSNTILTPTDLHWSGTNLGIGTTVPSAKLHVVGSTSFETDTAPFRFASSSTTSVSPYIYCLGKRNDANTSYAFAGRIGLAKHRTDSNIQAGSTLGMIAFGGNCSNAQESNISFTSSIIGISEQSFSNTETMATSIAFFTGNTGTSMNTLSLSAVGKERMRIHSSGNIGIGTTTPTYALDVKGPIRTTDQFINTVADGTSPFAIVSTTVSSNLNADLLDGQHGSFYLNMSNVSAGILSVPYGGIGTTSLSQNKLLVGNATNAVISAENLHWNGTNLGIGTSTPVDTLHVVGAVRTTSNFVSVIPTGTAPLQVASTTLNINLNADLLDGQHGAYYQNADNVITGTLAVSRGGTGLNSLTANKLLVGNNTSAITTPSDLHWASPNLGVGTTTPAAKLHVLGSVSFETEYTPFRFASSSITSVSPYIYCLGKRNDGNTSYSFAGRIGLAKHRTDSNISTGSTLGMIAFGGNCSNAQESNVAFASSIIGVSEQSFSNIESMATSIAFLTGSTGISMNTSNIAGIGKERMRIHSSGNIGIGTTTPAYALDVKGPIRTTDQFINTVVDGTPPFSILSTTLSSNLNADLLDGQHGSFYLNMSNVIGGILPIQYGGTGASNFTPNKLLVGSGSNTPLSPDLLHWSGASLGIGTTSPIDALHVVGSVRATSNFISMIPTGVAPLQVNSTTLNTNLNADLLDGQHGSYYQNANNITSGILSVQYGGTGASNLTQNKILVGNGSNAIASIDSLHWSGSNLGIGTTMPLNTLHVEGTIRMTSNLISTVSTGTAPLQVNSTTLNLNLNADLLDGQHGSYYQNANNITSGVLPVQYGGTGASNFTANKILVGNGSNSPLTPDLLHWSGASLGIGTTSPVDALHVVGAIRATSNLISTIPTGIAPLQVSSTTLNNNLNADLLDGQHGSYYQNVNNVNFGILPVQYGGTGASNLTQNKLLVGNGTGALFAPVGLHWNGANLGIGTITPKSPLSVHGSICIDYNANCDVTLENTVGGQGLIGLAAGPQQYSQNAQANDVVVRSLAGRIILQSGSTTYGLCVNSDNSVTTAYGLTVNGSISTAGSITAASLTAGSLTANAQGIIVNVGASYGALTLNNAGGGQGVFGLAYVPGHYSFSAAANDLVIRSVGQVHLQSGGGNSAISIDTNNNSTFTGTLKANGTATLSNLTGTNNNSGKLYSSTKDFIDIPITPSLISIDSLNGVLSRNFGFFATSDHRIKCDITSIDPEKACDIVEALRAVNYGYITHSNSAIQTGFIAQEVETVYPSAISYIRDKIPDIQQKIKIFARHQHTMTVSHAFSLPAVGTEIAVLDGNGKEWEFTVSGGHTIECSKNLEDFAVGDDNELFLYGRYVDDLRILDKDALFSLSVAALQRALQRIDSLESQLTSIKSHLNI